LNHKVALLLFVIIFASAAATIAISLKTPELSLLSVTRNRTFDPGIKPLGDPVDGPWGPG